MRRPFRLPHLPERGMLAVMACIVGAGLAWWYLRPSGRDSGGNVPVGEAERRQLDSFDLEIHRSHTARRMATPPRAEAFPFDPNTADSATMRRLGLPAWQVGNMMKYRRKGGHWRSPDDFRRLYGLTEADFRRLRPYIVTTGADRPHRADRPRTAVPHRFPQVEKYPAGTVIDLNAADTAMLKKIPGIGSYYARRICAYREQLGGYVDKAQLADIGGLPPGIGKWLRVNTYAPVRRLNVNRATFRELVRHPYLSYEQVKAIFDYRRKHGRIRSLSDLHLSGLFSPLDEHRLAPYLDF